VAQLDLAVNDLLAKDQPILRVIFGAKISIAIFELAGLDRGDEIER